MDDPCSTLGDKIAHNVLELLNLLWSYTSTHFWNMT